MAGEAKSVLGRTLERTPTWALATVCFILIVISIVIEHLFHILSKYFNKKRRKSLIQALDKIKSELMLLGFMSLLLTVGEKPIANICIPRSVGETFLPGQNITFDEAEEETKCLNQGKVSLLSRKGVQELQYLIFHLALFYVLSCVLTFSLGMAKMRRWESWEAETRTLEYQYLNDPQRFRLAHQTSFGKRHLRSWSSTHRFLLWPASFLRQFYESVSRVDYFTLRHGFISAHFAEGSEFDFRRYIRRALEKDFGVVMGISWWIWMSSIFSIFFNAYGLYSYLWLPFIPLAILLLVGTKLQGIITQMCLDSHKKSDVVKGTLLVRPSDDFFWFHRPRLLLHILSFILFQNSFQLAFFTWTWMKFGLRSRFHKETVDIVIRLAIGVIVQLLCGYVTLPLYALVTQMGTSMRKDVFTENVARGLKKWRAKAKRNLYSNNSSLPLPARLSFGASLETSLTSSPSFSLNTSYSVEFDQAPLHSEYVAVDIRDGVKVKGIELVEDHQHQMVRSINGFELKLRQLNY